MKRYRGTGKISSSDFKASIKWVGKTKNGKAIMIRLFNAINLGSMEWAFADKGEIVSEVTFTGSYTEAEMEAGSTAEPFEITCEENIARGEGSYVLGAGKFYINDVYVGICRGGGSFKRNATVREITADNDRGTVKDRVVIDEAKPTLTMNALEVVVNMTELYPGMVEAAADQIEIASVGNIAMTATDEKDVTIVSFPDDCTLTAAVTGTGSALSASVSGHTVTLESSSATVGQVYTVTVTGTKAGYTSGARAFTVTITA